MLLKGGVATPSTPPLDLLLLYFFSDALSTFPVAFCGVVSYKLSSYYSFSLSIDSSSPGPRY